MTVVKLGFKGHLLRSQMIQTPDSSADTTILYSVDICSDVTADLWPVKVVSRPSQLSSLNYRKNRRLNELTEFYWQ